eukprot:TRINITY_DN2845_c0_g2_i2.p1 TRINITY_DN2845_c0_g2~~TRINITY_DN2845_c0_g2_i2.p1  ORF type:complete len:290 (+),score=29.27 TRINITY_DN2845_c0_g2_i2:127-996(+)
MMACSRSGRMPNLALQGHQNRECWSPELSLPLTVGCWERWLWMDLVQKGKHFLLEEANPSPSKKRKQSKGRVTFQEPPASPPDAYPTRPRRGSAPPLEILATPPAIPQRSWSGQDISMLLSMPFCEVLDAYPIFARALESEPEKTKKGLAIDWLSPIKPPRLFNTLSSCIEQGMFRESTAPNTYRVPFNSIVSPVVSVASPPLDASAAEFIPRSLAAAPTPPSKSKLDPRAPEFTPPSVMKGKSPLPIAEDLLLPAGPATFITRQKKDGGRNKKPTSGESFDLYSNKVL